MEIADWTQVYTYFNYNINVNINFNKNTCPSSLFAYSGKPGGWRSGGIFPQVTCKVTVRVYGPPPPMTGSKFRMSAGGTRPRNQGPLGRTKPGGKLGTYSDILGHTKEIWIQIPETHTLLFIMVNLTYFMEILKDK